jgi:hypothetical protein
MKKQGKLLPKRNNRWKWMAGATAASAAAATPAHAQVVQISLVGYYNNSITSSTLSNSNLVS